MAPRILIVGIGNVFLGDDAFGVELVRRLQAATWPATVAIKDFGIRTVHLAHELLDAPELLIVGDAVHRSGLPGTVYLIEPELSSSSGKGDEAHGMDLSGVFALLERLGGARPRVLLVGCEPQSLEEGLELSEVVKRGIEEAVALIREVVERELGGQVPGTSEEATS